MSDEEQMKRVVQEAVEQALGSVMLPQDAPNMTGAVVVTEGFAPTVGPPTDEPVPGVARVWRRSGPPIPGQQYGFFPTVAESPTVMMAQHTPVLSDQMMDQPTPATEEPEVSPLGLELQALALLAERRAASMNTTSKRVNAACDRILEALS